MQSVAKKGKSKKPKKVVKKQQQKFGFEVDLEQEEPEVPQQTPKDEEKQGFKIVQNTHVKIERQEPPPQQAPEIESIPAQEQENSTQPVTTAIREDEPIEVEAVISPNQTMRVQTSLSVTGTDSQVPQHAKVIESQSIPLETVEPSALEAINGEKHQEVAWKQEKQISVEKETDNREEQSLDQEIQGTISKAKAEKKSKKEGSKTTTKKKGTKVKTNKSSMMSPNVVLQVQLDEVQAPEPSIDEPSPEVQEHKIEQGQESNVQPLQKVEETEDKGNEWLRQEPEPQVKASNEESMKVSYQAEDIALEKSKEAEEEIQAEKQPKTEENDEKGTEMVQSAPQQTEEMQIVQSLDTFKNAKKKAKKGKKKEANKPKKVSPALNTELVVEQSQQVPSLTPDPLVEQQIPQQQPSKEIFQQYSKDIEPEELITPSLQQQQQTIRLDPEVAVQLEQDATIEKVVLDDQLQSQAIERQQNTAKQAELVAKEEEQIQAKSISLVVSKKKPGKKDSKKNKKSKVQSVMQMDVLEEAIEVEPALQKEVSTVVEQVKQEDESGFQSTEKQRQTLVEEDRDMKTVSYQEPLTPNIEAVSVEKGHDFSPNPQASFFPSKLIDLDKAVQQIKQSLDYSSEVTPVAEVVEVNQSEPEREQKIELEVPKIQQQTLDIENVSFNVQAKPKKGSKKSTTKTKSKNKVNQLNLDPVNLVAEESKVKEETKVKEEQLVEEVKQERQKSADCEVKEVVEPSLKLETELQAKSNDEEVCPIHEQPIECQQQLQPQTIYTPSVTVELPSEEEKNKQQENQEQYNTVAEVDLICLEPQISLPKAKANKKGAKKADKNKQKGKERSALMSSGLSEIVQEEDDLVSSGIPSKDIETVQKVAFDHVTQIKDEPIKNTIVLASSLQPSPSQSSKAEIDGLKEQKSKKRQIFTELINMVRFQGDQKLREINDRLKMLEEDIRSRVLRQEEQGHLKSESGQSGVSSQKLRIYSGIVDQNIALRSEIRGRNVQM